MGRVVPLLGAALSLVAFFAIQGCEDVETKKKNEELNAQIGELSKNLKAAEGKAASFERKLKRAERRVEILESEIKTLKISAMAGDVDEVRKKLKLRPGQKLYATFKTSMGDIVAELFVDRAPLTVLNFVQLAEGDKEWTDPRTKRKTKARLYDGTIFHRVIPNFMVQAGDPLGTGTGGPGFKIPDEFHPELRHDGPGILSMANTGRPNTGGSQFFITEKATKHLDGKHSVFGKVIENVELIPKMTRVDKKTANPQDSRPSTPIELKAVKIGRGQPIK